MKRMFTLNQASDSITIKNAFERFISNCEIKNLSQETIGFYKLRYDFFLEFLENDDTYIKFAAGSQRLSENNLCNEINEDIIECYISYLRNKKTLAPVSIENKLRGLRTFINYCVKKRYMEYIEIPKYKYDEKLKVPYTQEEIDKLIEHPSKKANFIELRDWAVVCFELATSCRLNTTVNVKNKDLDFFHDKIMLTTNKNRKQYSIDMSPVIREVLLEYMEVRQGAEEDYLFCNIYGSQMSKSGLARSIREYNRKRGVQKTGFHRYRHTFGSAWAATSGDIYTLKEIMGHSSIRVTETYIHQFGFNKKEIMQQHSCLEQAKNMINSKRKKIKI